MQDITDETTAVVADASFVLSRLMPDETPREDVQLVFDRLADQSLAIYAPTILKYEVANAIRFALKSSRMSKSIADSLVEQFLALPIKYQEVDWHKTLHHAISHDLTIYDAAYIALARSLGFPLMTLDSHLRRL